MALLYQEIMNVPGLSGSWKDRLSQYYTKLTGKDYRGTRDEGIYMLGQIAKGNYAQPEATTTSTATSTTPELSMAEQYSKSITDQANKIASIPTFQQTMPFYDAWNQMVPQATLAAESQINPEVMRDYNAQYKNYMSGMASSGGQRFGTGLGGVGDLKAAAERSRQGQLQDWLGQYQQGYRSLFYDPSAQAWDASATQGIAPDQTLKNIPKWEDVYDKTSTAFGTGESNSPLYG